MVSYHPHTAVRTIANLPASLGGVQDKTMYRMPNFAPSTKVYLIELDMQASKPETDPERDYIPKFSVKRSLGFSSGY